MNEIESVRKLTGKKAGCEMDVGTGICGRNQESPTTGIPPGVFAKRSPHKLLKTKDGDGKSEARDFRVGRILRE